MTPLALTLGQAFLYEFVGTAILILLGCGVVANAVLPRTKGYNTGFLFINWGWAIAVLAGVYFAQPSGGHLNPAVTIGLAVKNMVLGIDNDWGMIFTYIVAQLLGAMFGAFLCWAAYKQHFDAEGDAGAKLGTFATGPAIRHPLWNTVTEVIATFVLVGWVIIAGLMDPKANAFIPLGVALLVLGIGASLGGPTGYAINPARDLGPRIMHQLLPIKGKGSSDWGYSWVPVVGPILGAILAGLIVPLLYKVFLVG